MLETLLLPFCQSQATYVTGRRLLEETNLSAEEEVLYIALCIFLVCFSGICAGLTLGLLSLDKLDIEVIKASGTPRERKLALRVEPLIKNPHLLLVTLLFWNACAVEALPIFLDRLLNPIAAIAISVTAILIVGEIFPQALCKRYGLQIGAYMNWYVRLLMFVAFPVAWPIGKLLDWLLGHDTVLFRRNELKALVTMHGADSRHATADTGLSLDEVTVIQGALDLAHKTAQEAMTPLDSVFSLSEDEVVNRELLERVIKAGHSRIPIYRGNNKQAIFGLILVKELVLVDETAGFKISDLKLRELPYLEADVAMYSALTMFRNGRSHMAVLKKVKKALPVPPPVQIVRFSSSQMSGGTETTTTTTATVTKKPTSKSFFLKHMSFSKDKESDGHVLEPISGAVSVDMDLASSSPSSVRSLGLEAGGQFPEAVPSAPTSASFRRMNSSPGAGSPTPSPFSSPTPPDFDVHGGNGVSPAPTNNGDGGVTGPQQAGLPLFTEEEEEEIVGIITIEDIIEELLQREIYDESDVRMHSHAAGGGGHLKFLTRATGTTSTTELEGGGGSGNGGGGLPRRPSAAANVVGLIVNTEQGNNNHESGRKSPERRSVIGGGGGGGASTAVPAAQRAASASPSDVSSSAPLQGPPGEFRVGSPARTRVVGLVVKKGEDGGNGGGDVL